MGLYRVGGSQPGRRLLPDADPVAGLLRLLQPALSTAVELWRSPWIGWIHDLTAPDPYYVLPIVMGISQIVQQRMTPAPPDPMQHRLMQFLPIVFTIFSLGFAVGLVLYWLTNNILTSRQQKLYNSIKDQRAERGGRAASKKAGGRKAITLMKTGDSSPAPPCRRR